MNQADTDIDSDTDNPQVIPTKTNDQVCSIHTMETSSFL